MMTLTKDDLAAIEGLFTGKFDGIDKQFESMEQRFDSLETKVEGIDSRLEHVESDVSSLKCGQLQLSRNLKKVSDRVEETYKLALENWGQIEESKGRLALLER